MWLQIADHDWFLCTYIKSSLYCAVYIWSMFLNTWTIHRLTLGCHTFPRPLSQLFQGHHSFEGFGWLILIFLQYNLKVQDFSSCCSGFKLRFHLSVTNLCSFMIYNKIPGAFLSDCNYPTALQITMKNTYTVSINFHVIKLQHISVIIKTSASQCMKTRRCASF